MDNNSFHGALKFFCLTPEQKLVYLQPRMGRRRVDLGEYEFETESELKFMATYLSAAFEWDSVSQNLEGDCLVAASALVSILDVAWNEKEPFWNAEIMFDRGMFENTPPFWEGAALLARIAIADSSFCGGRLAQQDMMTFTSLLEKFTSAAE